MKKSEKKDFVFSKLSETLKTDDFYLVKTGLDPTFVLKYKEYTVSFFLNFKDLGEIDFSRIRITFNNVEAVMFEIKLPDNDYAFVDNKKYFLTTVEDKISAMPPGYSAGAGYKAETKEDVEFFTSWITAYLENDGKKFIEKFTCLPAILKEMDRLEKQGRYWNEILSGGPEFLFRGLIISRLCGDEKYDGKVLYVEGLLAAMADEYLPYFEKLKLKLESLAPEFNVKN